eukprot:m.155055 g.155055  ORF g.155055 m.155055 type:complete len:107 (-) comp16403_c0_seq16:267-587(-)
MKNWGNSDSNARISMNFVRKINMLTIASLIRMISLERNVVLLILEEKELIIRLWSSRVRLKAQGSWLFNLEGLVNLQSSTSQLETSSCSLQVTLHVVSLRIHLFTA